jgi:hypothetical protein
VHAYIRFGLDRIAAAFGGADNAVVDERIAMLTNPE